jgi:hypothetical protein
MAIPLEVQGLRKLRTYSLISIISTIISLFLDVLFPFTTPFPAVPPGSPPGTIVRVFERLMNVILPFLIVGAILSIISLLFLRSGFKELVRAGRDLKTGLTGASIYLVAFVLLMIGVAVLFTSLVQVLPSISSNAPPPSPYLAPLVGGVLIVIIGAIAALVGVIMVIIGLYKVGSIYQDGLIKVGAILIIIPYLSIVAPFLLFFGLGNAIRKAETGFSPQTQNYPPPPPHPQYPPAPPQQGPAVYQVGVGTLDDSGVARLTLYSASPLTLSSAVLQTPTGPRQAISFSPRDLSPGYNNLEVQLGFISLPKGTYNLDLTFANGVLVRTFVTH